MVLSWLRRLDEDVLQGRTASRLVITVPLYLFLGVIVLGGVGFVPGVYLGLGLFDGYDGFLLPYLGALLGSLVGGGFGVLLAIRHKR